MKIEEVIDRLRKPVREPVSKPVSTPPVVRSNLEPSEYQARVRKAKDYIVAGDVIQVVVAQRFQCELRAHPFNIYRCLRTLNPSPYMFFLRVGTRTVLGASPEVMVRLVRIALGHREQAYAAVDRQIEPVLLAAESSVGGLCATIVPRTRTGSVSHERRHS